MSETDTLKGKVSHLEAVLAKAKEEWIMKDQQLEQLDVKVQQMNAMFINIDQLEYSEATTMLQQQLEDESL